MAKVLYAILFSDGDIKVGVTTNFDKRLSAHKAENKKIGKRDVVSYFSKECLNLTEIDLIRICETNSKEIHGSEYFSGLDFDFVKSVINTDLIPVAKNNTIGDLTTLFNIINQSKIAKGECVINITQFCRSKETQDFLDALANRLKVSKKSLIYTVGKGKSAKTMANTFVLIYTAKKYLDNYMVEVIDTFINSKLLSWRDESGDHFKGLNEEIKSAAENLLGKPAHQGHFITIAKIVNARVGDKVEWNTATAEQLKERDRIETGLCTVIKLGVVKDWEHLKQIAAEV